MTIQTENTATRPNIIPHQRLKAMNDAMAERGDIFAVPRGWIFALPTASRR